MQNSEFSYKDLFNMVGAASVGTLGASLLLGSLGGCDPMMAAAGTIASTAGLATSLLLGDGLAMLNRSALNPATSNQYNSIFPFMGNRGKPLTMPRSRVQSADNTPLAQMVKRLEMKVVTALEENEIPFSNRQVVVAPRHITIKFKLGKNDMKTVDRAFNCERSISLNTGTDRIRLYIDGFYFCVELANPKPQVVYASTLEGGRGVKVPIGTSSNRETVYIDFADPATPHLALPGPTGRGKTQTERTIAYHLARQNMPEDVKFIVFAQKREDWEVFRNLPHLAAIITDPQEIVLAMNWASELTRLRSAKASMSRKPRLFLFMDDTIALLNVTQGLIQPALEYISAQGRAPGCHLIFGTQDWTNAGSGGSTVKANVMARVLFGASSTTKAATSAGRGKTGAHKLQGKGDTLYICDNEETPTAAAMATDQEIIDLLGGGRPMPRQWRPWLDDAPEQKISKQAASNGQFNGYDDSFVSPAPAQARKPAQGTSDQNITDQIMDLFVNKQMGISAIVAEIWKVEGGRNFRKHSETVSAVIRDALMSAKG